MSSETNEDSDVSDIENHPDNRQMLQRLKVIEENVRKLRMRKFELEKQLQQPMKYGDVMYTQHEAASAVEVEENLNQVERKHYIKRLFFHKLTGVKPILQEKKDIVFEFNASVKGLYMEPYYLRMRKVQTGKYEVVNYFLPESVLVREMVGDSSYVNDKQIFQLIYTIQHYVLAYHRRREQISQVKELLKDMKFFYSTDYRFVEFTFMSDIKIPALNVTLSLIYDCGKDVPSNLKLHCKETDKKTLSNIRKEVNAFLKLPLNEAVDILTTQESNSDQSIESHSTIIFQTSQERDDSLEEEADDDEIWQNDLNKNTKKRHKIKNEPPEGATKDKKKSGSVIRK